MNTAISWSLALLASLATLPGAIAEPPAPANRNCEFISFDDEFPFVHVDPTCPPIPSMPVAGF